MDKVYLVTTGEYSAYTVEAVCSTKELAHKLGKALGRKKLRRKKAGHGEWKDKYVEDYAIEEFPLNTVLPKIYYWYARIDRKSDTLEVIKQGEPCLVNEFWHNDEIIDCHGATKEEAIKNISDYKARILAEEQGIT